MLLRKHFRNARAAIARSASALTARTTSAELRDTACCGYWRASCGALQATTWASSASVSFALWMVLWKCAERSGDSVGDPPHKTQQRAGPASPTKQAGALVAEGFPAVANGSLPRGLGGSRDRLRRSVAHPMWLAQSSVKDSSVALFVCVRSAVKDSSVKDSAVVLFVCKRVSCAGDQQAGRSG